MSPTPTPAPVTLKHPEGEVTIEEAEDGLRRVSVVLSDPAMFMPSATCETIYPVELIEAILRVKGPAWLCYSLRREEDTTDIERILRSAVFAFVGEDELAGKRLLDFGCGSGASTLIFKRLLPDLEVVGIDLAEEMLEIARMRAAYRGIEVEFLQSPGGDQLPPDIGTFDAILFSAVLEHMLPAERVDLLPKVWALLRPGGVLFLNQTPHRYYPYEGHTTELPLINFVPERLALWAARRFSRRVEPDASWHDLLRAGIRGGTEGEVLRILRAAGDGEPVSLRPTRLGMTDPADIWFAYSMARNPRRFKQAMRVAFKGISRITGGQFGPDLNLALRKQGGSAA